ncbi:MAG: AI-2E family transporter [Acidobacteriota bacterium]
MTIPTTDAWSRRLQVLACAALVTYVFTQVGGLLLRFFERSLELLTPFLIAFAIAYLLDPVVDWFEARGRSRNFGITIVVLAATAVLALGVLTLDSAGEQLAETKDKLFPSQAPSAPKPDTPTKSHVQQLVDKVKENLPDWAKDPVDQAVSRSREFLRNAVDEIDWGAVANQVKKAVIKVGSGGAAVLGALANFLLIPISAAYLLKDIDRIKEAIADLIPPRWRQVILDPMAEIDQALSSFVRGQLTVAAFLAVIYSIGLVASGTPLGLPLGLFAGAVSFVPYLGLAIGLVPALLLNFIDNGSLPRLIAVGATFAIAQFLEGMIITPRIMSGTVGLHPVLVLIAVFIGGSLFGVAGMLLALPAAAAGMVLLRRADTSYRESAWFRKEKGDDEPPSTEVV